MAGGRPRKPTQVKEMKGTLQKSRELPNKMEVAPVSSIPSAPNDLDEHGQSVWYSTASQLSELGILSTLDLVMLKEYCYQVSLMQKAKVFLKDGLTITMTNKGGGSYEVKSPYISIYNEALTHASRIAQQFGFTPASRQKIVTVKPEEEGDDPWRSF